MHDASLGGHPRGVRTAECFPRARPGAHRSAPAGRAGDAVSVSIDHNILDQGRPIGDLLADVEAGTTTLCYFSTSYLAERVPEVGLVDLPYLFASLAHAHAALDGTFGARLSERTAAATDLRPARLLGQRLPPPLQPLARGAHARGLPRPEGAAAAELGARALLPRARRGAGRTDLRDGIAMLVSGELDAQENPLANFVAYGIERLHPHLSLTAHVYGARGVYASARQLATASSPFQIRVPSLTIRTR